MSELNWLGQIAGTDTTATALRAMLLYITAFPTCYAALQAAIDKSVNSGKISSPITDSDLGNQRHFHIYTVIKEGLRKFP